MKKTNEKFLSDKEYIISELECRFWEKDIPSDILYAIDKIRFSSNYEEFTDILNTLLINPNHYSHQYVTWLLQHIKSPTSIPYIKQVLESKFSYLEYTYSESGVIAKWFSWALASIGTKEAIDIIREYTESEDEEVKNEMLYRLSRIDD